MTIDTKRGRELYAAATPGEWSGYRMVHADRGDDMSPEECGEYVCNSVRKSALESGSNAFLAILCQKQDGPADVCHVGNGPTSPANCAWIAWAHSNAPALLDAAEECERLREQVESLLSRVEDVTGAREWHPDEKYHSYVRGFRDGAAITAMKHPDVEAYDRGYGDGQKARQAACDAYAKEVGYEPSILRTSQPGTEKP